MWQEIQHLRHVFRANCYPESVVKSNLRAQPSHHATPPTGFIIFLSASVATHVTVQDVLVTRRWNLMIMQHFSHKLASFTKTSIPIHNKSSVCELKEVTLLFSQLHSSVI